MEKKNVNSSILKEIENLSIGDVAKSKSFLINSGLSKDIVEKLFDYQKSGVEWLIKKFYSNFGGAIIADDMGLGKTIQVLCFLNCLYQQHKIKTILLILPKSLVENWINEICCWFPDVHYVIYEGTMKKRQTKLSNVQVSSGILITTYGMVQTSYKQLSSLASDLQISYVWDCVVLDEAHKIRNYNKTTRRIYHIKAKFKLALTGTPLQNNIVEMYNLVNFVSNDKLFMGGRKLFGEKYSNIIEKGLFKDATDLEKKLGQEKLDELHEIMIPYILRRTKNEQVEFLSKIKNCNITKLDLVVWVRMTDIQIEIYKEFLQSDEVKKVIASLHVNKSSGLFKLSILRKIPNHPFLSINNNLISEIIKSVKTKLNDCQINIEDIDGKIGCNSDKTYVHSPYLSCKINYTLKLLEELIRIDSCHKVIIFSQSRQLLDYLGSAISSQLNLEWLQIDGRNNSISFRQQIINKFQDNPLYRILLATIQVAGIGLNLTAADRIIILEPSWNPGIEYQAIDRACRIGQKKDVVVYRLITCGTVEEQMYRRQIFKDSLVKHVVENVKNPARYFSCLDLAKLFTFGDPNYSSTLNKLLEIGKVCNTIDNGFNEQSIILTRCGAYGVNDNGYLYEQINNNINIFNEQLESYINPVVHMRQQLDNNELFNDEMDSFFEKGVLSSTRLNSTPMSSSVVRLNNDDRMMDTDKIQYIDSVKHSTTSHSHHNSSIILLKKNRFFEDSLEQNTLTINELEDENYYTQFDHETDDKCFQLLVESFSCKNDSNNIHNGVIDQSSHNYVSCDIDHRSSNDDNSIVKGCMLCRTRLNMIQYIAKHKQCICSVSEYQKSLYYSYIEKACTLETHNEFENALFYYLEALAISDSDLNVILAVKRLYTNLYEISIF